MKLTLKIKFKYIIKKARREFERLLKSTDKDLIFQYMIELIDRYGIET